MFLDEATKRGSDFLADHELCPRSVRVCLKLEELKRRLAKNKGCTTINDANKHDLMDTFRTGNISQITNLTLFEVHY